jgi:hypothetical protein
MGLRSSDGKPVRLLAYEGERGQIVLSHAAPPGTPLLLLTDTGTTLQMKVNRCQKIDAEFHVEGRWVSLTREHKAWLERELRDLSAASSGDDPDRAR